MDRALKEEWLSLHKELVQRVIDWIKDHHIENVDLVAFRADCLNSSVKEGKWCPDTDSCLELYQYNEDPDDWGRVEEPLLFSV